MKPRQLRRRVRRLVLAIIRRTFRRLAPVYPHISSRVAEHMFRTPPRSRPLPFEARTLAEARFSRTPFGPESLPTWTWGRGPAVLLVHGWGGHAGRLSSYVAPLVRAGFSVVAFDAPGHGMASGRRSGLPEFVRAIRAVARSRGPFEAVVGHSLGATACALAAREGLRVSKLVLLAPPSDPEKYWGRFVRYYRMPAATRDAMKDRLASRYGTTWEALRVMGGSCPAQLLVFHDRGDPTVPLADGVEVMRSWRDGRIVRTRGLGHHRILRNPKVVARAVAFLTAREPRRVSPPRRPRVLKPVPAS